MIRSTAFFIISIALLWTGMAVATDWRDFMMQRSELVLQTPAISQPSPQALSATTLSTKSPKTGFFLSAVVPGAGQLYSGAWAYAAGFVAVEALSWWYYWDNHRQGNDIDVEFRAFADQHWSEPEYWQWISQHSGIAYNPNDLEPLRDWEHANFSHGLHRDKDQQYYEMIGKYDQFNYAWDDSDIGLLDEGWSKAFRSKRRLYYEDRRLASNQAFKRATTGLTVVIVNHLLSATQAAWIIHHQNKPIRASLQIEPKRLDKTIYSALTLRMQW